MKAQLYFGVGSFLSWVKDTHGTALVEAVLILPVLMTMMMGVYDLGNGIIVKQKNIKASQIIADLITRLPTVDMDDVENFITAGELAIEPYSVNNFGVDIVSVILDGAGSPSIDWRETRNMLPNNAVLSEVAGLEDAGEGVLIVTVSYSYTPLFSNFFVDDFNMQEVFYMRGRQSSGVGCSNC